MSPAFIRSEQLKITFPDKVACLAEHVIQPPPVDCQQQAVILLPRVSRPPGARVAAGLGCEVLQLRATPRVTERHLVAARTNSALYVPVRTAVDTYIRIS